jgi:hypothetical protein
MKFSVLPNLRQAITVVAVLLLTSMSCNANAANVTAVRSKPQQNQLLSVGRWFCFVVIGLQGA